MQKINSNTLAELSWSSPKGKFTGAGKELLMALEQERKSANLTAPCPFDIEILRIPPGKTPYPYHSHSAQWEFYHVISGNGIARDETGRTPIEPGDAFVFGPGEAHQLINDGSQDLIIYVVADNPVGESGYFPDSKKWLIRSPERTIIRSETLDYYDGEE